MPELKTALKTAHLNTGYAQVNGVRLHYKSAGRGKLIQSADS